MLGLRQRGVVCFSYVGFSGWGRGGGWSLELSSVASEELWDKTGLWGRGLSFHACAQSVPGGGGGS